MKAQQGFHTTDRVKMDRMWLMLGGTIEPVRRTGEMRYRHPQIPSPLTINGRRKHVPAKLLSRVNQVRRQGAVNDELY